ncbi:sensor domain-containing protein [Galenea microaerophila]
MKWSQRINQILINTFKNHPLRLFFPLLLIVLTATTSWNLSLQYQAFQSNTQTVFESTKQRLVKTLTQLNQSFSHLQDYHNSANFNLRTFENLMEAEVLTSGFKTLAYAVVEKHPQNFVREMQEKGFESCQIHHHILSLNSEKEATTPLPYPLPIIFVFPYTPEEAVHFCEDLSPFIKPDRQSTYSLIVQHKYKPNPVILQIAPFYLYNHLQSVLVNIIDPQQLLEDIYSGKDGGQVQLYANGHLIADINHIEPAHFSNIALHTLQLQDDSFQFLDQSTTLKYFQPYTLRQIDYFSLSLSLMVATLIYLLLFALTREIILHYETLNGYKQRLKQLIQNTHDAIIITDDTGKIRTWSPAAQALFDYPETEVKGKEIFSLICLSDPEKPFSARLKQLLNDPDTPRKLKANKSKFIQAQIKVIPIEIEGKFEYFFEIHDITHELKQAKRIEQLAYYDSLTGLENRILFKENLKQLIQQEPETQLAILFLDLDGFKQVNDTLGHDAGDELLKVVALRLRRYVHIVDRYHHLCRFGGDEFILSLPFRNQHAIEKFAQDLLKPLQRPIHLSFGTVTISASIGIALYPKDGDDYDTLIRRADSAMYAAKNKGKNSFCFYHPSMEEQLDEQMKIEQALKTAIPNNELFLVYQPKINSENYQLQGFEALIRWIHPELGFVPPDKFIPVAEESNLIHQIGDWVIETALKQLQQWQQHPNLKNIPVAINLSGNEMIIPNFFEDLAKKVSKYQLTPELLELELTERTVMTNVESNLQHLNTMTALGFKLAIDDFGTGYSSLSYLKRLPIHTLKVDKSFVDGLPDNEHDKAISLTILKLAQTLKLHTVAEGVETMAQFECLCKAGCETIQGYLFSKPLKVEEIENWFQQHKKQYIDNPENRCHK